MAGTVSGGALIQHEESHSPQGGLPVNTGGYAGRKRLSLGLMTMAFLRLVFGLGALALFAQPAAADPALATGDVNMRTGPSTNAPVILLIPGGSNVEVLGCGYGWCEVVFGGRAGHAIQQRFDFGGDPPPPPRQIGPPRGYAPSPYPAPRPGYPPPYPTPTYPPPYGEPGYPPGQSGPYMPPPYRSPYGPIDDDDGDDYGRVLPPPGIDPRALPQRPPANAQPRPPAQRPPANAQRPQQPHAQQQQQPAPQAPPQQQAPAQPPAQTAPPQQAPAQPPAPQPTPPAQQPVQANPPAVSLPAVQGQ